MEINYSSEVLTSANYDYDGQTEDGREFVIHALWDTWDDYAVDFIEWINGSEGTDEEEEEIIEAFLDAMN
jgi:heme-degrading monooxygenase HmoA